MTNMEYVYVLTVALILVIAWGFKTRRAIKKAYRRGFDEGYSAGIEFERNIVENVKRYADMIRRGRSE